MTNSGGLGDMCTFVITLYGLQRGWSIEDTTAVHKLFKERIKLGTVTEPADVHRILDSLYEEVSTN